MGLKGMSIIKKVHMLILMVPDKKFKECVEFYNKIGLNPKFHLQGKWAEFEKGNVLIGLCPTEQELPERRTGIVMEVEDLKKKHEAFKDTVEFLGEPTEAVHGIMISIKDPGGNIFDLYQPTPEKVRDLAKKTAGQQCSKNPCCGEGRPDCPETESCCGEGEKKD